ncbi:PepSY domain-containing protein [uncultured Anaerococcus sp.]|uniref:PepSY domain-containing protein n=1 Tax=uncultured Anaerococcus sp. TaxID=293428 RepID=UPI00288A96E2|nr:PepSY domain-containing protein [uncultured Anaerococcus sp.]
MKNKKIILLLATALILGACGKEAAKPAEKTKQKEIQVDETKTGVKEVKNDDKKPNEEEKEKVPEFATNIDEALKIFHKHNFGDGSFDAINIDKLKVKILDKDIIYSIEGFKDGKEYKLKINNKGEILEEEVEEDDDNKKIAIDFTKIISGVDAMNKAIEGQDEKAWVKGYEIEIEDGKVVYDLDVENGQDVKIDATSGQIIERD